MFSLLQILLHECEDMNLIRMKYFLTQSHRLEFLYVLVRNLLRDFALFLCYFMVVYSEIERIYAGLQRFSIPKTL